MSRENQQSPWSSDAVRIGKVTPAQSCYKLGKALAQKGRWLDAIAQYEKALAFDPNHQQARQQLEAIQNKRQTNTAFIPERTPEGRRHRQQSQYYAQQKQWEAAAEELQALIKVEPTFEAYRDLARVYHYLQKPTLAAQYWYEALVLKPDQANAQEHLQLGNTLAQQEEWEQAITCYQRAIERDPQLFEAHRNLAAGFAQQQQWEQAVIAYQKALAINSDSAAVYQELGTVLEEQENWEAAAEAYRCAIARENDLVWSYYRLGKIALHLQHWQEAVAALQNAIQLQEDLPNIQVLLADGLRMRARADLEKAVEYYHCAIALNPDDEELYHKALDAKPDDSNLYQQLATLLEKKGNHQAAQIFHDLA
ncbi:Tetratricopeptide TPR_1 repeat-containing protein [Halothece sp. PCC 7418]|uniref:tetratricopeptide repeat protein n=1 Tax=Halothece sp. (strain PCC 7418) TaxID=65093 RepID=UPI0002A067EC|nr:tetratricopeptide repeat protein [Halothece sp. PCC 7418]AFZ43433.1 Tetratricopeptide TPR_1 repeat-containing protein [Halothece sp. PCC 7418]